MYHIYLENRWFYFDAENGIRRTTTKHFHVK